MFNLRTLNRSSDFLAIGDIVNDEFVHLSEAKVVCNSSDQKCELCLRFADKIPYDSITLIPAVGNSPNASVCASRLGLKTSLITNLGDDEQGKLALSQLKKEGIDISRASVHRRQKTNHHLVLWYGDDRTILIKHEPYPYKLPNFPLPKILYLSSLGADTLDYQLEIVKRLKKSPETKLVFQPGTYQIKAGVEALRPVYSRADLFFANLDEARRILKTDETNPKVLLLAIKNLGPKIVILTDGRKGAYAQDEDGHYWQVPVFPDQNPPLERTGAGDSFSATVTAGLFHYNLSLLEALTWGPINSMSVIQKIGAQAGLLNKEKLLQILATAPSSYRVTPF